MASCTDMKTLTPHERHLFTVHTACADQQQGNEHKANEDEGAYYSDWRPSASNDLVLRQLDPTDTDDQEIDEEDRLGDKQV